MPTQVKTTYNDIHRWDNLLLAYRKASRGKRSRPAVAAFEYRLEDNLFQLQYELSNEVYQPGPYASFTIHEPKHRLISAAPFRDRVVHHALCQVIEPAFEASFIHHSYADNLMARAADVQLKEGRPLLLMVRETPLHLGHLRLMTQAAEMGAIIFPPAPAFYARPQTLDEMVANTVGRMLARIGIENDTYDQWTGVG